MLFHTPVMFAEQSSWCEFDLGFKKGSAMRDKNLFGMLLVIGLGCSVADHSVAGVILTANGAELTLRNTSPIDGGELRLRNTSAIGAAANLTLQNSAAISINTSGPMAMPGDTPQIGWRHHYSTGGGR